jgi:hypothetical protein
MTYILVLLNVVFMVHAFIMAERHEQWSSTWWVGMILSAANGASAASMTL